MDDSPAVYVSGYAKEIQGYDALTLSPLISLPTPGQNLRLVKVTDELLCGSQRNSPNYLTVYDISPGLSAGGRKGDGVGTRVVRQWKGGAQRNTYGLEAICHRNGSGSFAETPACVVHSSDDQTSDIWDVMTGKLLHKLPLDECQRVFRHVPEWNDSLLTGGYRSRLGFGSYPVRIFDLEKNICVSVRKMHRNDIYGLSADVETDCFYSAGWDSRVGMWDRRTDSQLANVRLSSGARCCLAVPDIWKLYVGLHNGKVVAYDSRNLQQKKTVFSIGPARSETWQVIRVTPSRCVSVGQSSVAMWEAETGKFVKTVTQRLDQNYDVVSVGLPYDRPPVSTVGNSEEEEERVRYLMRLAEEEESTVCRCRVTWQGGGGSGGGGGVSGPAALVDA